MQKGEDPYFISRSSDRCFFQVKNSFWEVVEERFTRRPVMWKRQYLLKGGRLTLIKSALSSLPIYHMSLFVISKNVLKA